MTPPIVAAEGVRRTYRMGEGEDGATVHALRGVSFTIAEGEYVSIAGPSGSGKSTLLHLLGALDRPDEGTIAFRGRDVADLSDAELAELRNRAIGFVFQSFHLLPRATALDNVTLPLVYRGTPHRERRERAARALEAVGLGDRLEHHPNQLSGGQQQRVAIARALVGEPDLLLADEPTGNLDTVTGDEVMSILRRLHRERGSALVVITHEARIAADAGRRIQLVDGTIRDEDDSAWVR
ncbi:MAG: ABC transporter ATP-binding protein [Actinobacteria bacterium]|nr:ABC transporter ATP-binding protein [Actinomycetota bacterium]